MKSQALHHQTTKEVSPRVHAALTIPVFILGGSIISFLGYGIGVLAALGLGLPAPFDYGGMPGYEGGALFVGMLGAAVASVAMISLWMRGSHQLKWALFTYSIVWLVSTTIHHYVVLSTRTMVPGYVIAPIMITGIIIPILLITNRR